jgi:hypothetical protein
MTPSWLQFVHSARPVFPKAPTCYTSRRTLQSLMRCIVSASTTYLLLPRGLRACRSVRLVHCKTSGAQLSLAVYRVSSTRLTTRFTVVTNKHRPQVSSPIWLWQCCTRQHFQLTLQVVALWTACMQIYFHCVRDCEHSHITTIHCRFLSLNKLWKHTYSSTALCF